MFSVSLAGEPARAVGMAGIEPTRSSPQMRRPAIGHHPESVSLCRPDERACRHCTQLDNCAPSMHTRVPRNAVDRSRPRRRRAAHERPDRDEQARNAEGRPGVPRRPSLYVDMTSLVTASSPGLQILGCRIETFDEGLARMENRAVPGHRTLLRRHAGAPAGPRGRLVVGGLARHGESRARLPARVNTALRRRPQGKVSMPPAFSRGRHSGTAMSLSSVPAAYP